MTAQDVEAFVSESEVSSTVFGETEGWWQGGIGLFISRLMFVGGVVGVWELASRLFDLTFWISTPVLVFQRLWDWLLSGYAFYNAMITFQEAVLGFALGAAAGVTAGLILGLVPYLSRVTEPLVVAAYSMPKIALAPLLIVWIGIGMEMKVALAAISCFFLIMFNTITGVKNVEGELLSVIVLMGGGRWSRLKEVVIPSALVWVFAGLRISLPYALIGAVTGEIITSNRGLGFVLTSAGNQLDTTGVITGLIILAIAGTLLYMVITAVERRALRWQGAAS